MRLLKGFVNAKTALSNPRKPHLAPVKTEAIAGSDLEVEEDHSDGLLFRRGAAIGGDWMDLSRRRSGRNLGGGRRPRPFQGRSRRNRTGIDPKPAAAYDLLEIHQRDDTV